jgi:NTE family protein
MRGPSRSLWARAWTGAPSSETSARATLKALTVTATHVSSGRPVVFVDCADGVSLPTGSAHRRSWCAGSGSCRTTCSPPPPFPSCFPPVRIRSDLYVRRRPPPQHAHGPRAAHGRGEAAHRGRVHAGGQSKGSLPTGRFPGAPFLLGKVLNAFLIDHINDDLEELERINGILMDGEAAYGARLRWRAMARRASCPGRRPGAW